MRAIWEGAVLAESDHTRVVEGNHYFPPASIRTEYFEESTQRTQCGWKGEARYKTIVVEGKRNEDAAWFYAAPKPAAAEIQDHLAFWRGVEVCE